MGTITHFDSMLGSGCVLEFFLLKRREDKGQEMMLCCMYTASGLRLSSVLVKMSQFLQSLFWSSMFFFLIQFLSIRPSHVKLAHASQWLVRCLLKTERAQRLALPASSDNIYFGDCSLRGQRSLRSHSGRQLHIAAGSGMYTHRRWCFLKKVAVFRVDAHAYF